MISMGLLLATVLFIAGCFSPLFTLSKFFIFNNTVSLFSAMQSLWLEHYYALFLLLMSFSVALPLIKLCLLFYLNHTSRISQGKHKKLIAVLELIGKWSMLDVFVVAVILVAVKLGPMANVAVHYGVYLFSAAVLLMMLLSRFISR